MASIKDSKLRLLSSTATSLLLVAWLGTQGAQRLLIWASALAAAGGYDRVEELQKFVEITGRVATHAKNRGGKNT